MFVHQLIGRAKSPGDAEQICRLFQHSLSLVQVPGYARGVCAINQTDHVTVLIQEEWYNQAGLKAWQTSGAYQQLVHSLETLLEGVWEVTEYRQAGA